ncbi:MAG: 3-dehydroquinate synthase [Peptostreptococcus sp.]|uniref:3-dehydroquinate synthase n=1 Tax=Peptostreptococcus TaxID=1257 RepID=UPI00033B2429|nr:MULTISPECIES: 3-dehydroquinate synthase [Peptostreptococcus]MCB6982313.1 3-dehydroquinate synthase [Peptostreptococcus anaerobius]MCQ5150082.1 3-dehydroquinate synthase [Peptostreptococcus anaerobius]MDB8850455.1 3-dehydroquinate synthase [Peptostreptococcus anaerobius]MDB8851038.1 3-dehydroquinate synthase [Peptostreptococcus anaerobius]MDB8854122.1 3-dehydroquinate synthase [Peptostreptococcus anaerobius]
MRLNLRASSGDYDIIIEKGCATSRDGIGEHLIAYLKTRSLSKIYILTDTNIDRQGLATSEYSYSQVLEYSLKESGYEVYKRVIQAGEASKHISNLSGIYDDLSKKGITRSDIIIALGGGVVGDLAGFVAATYLRGIDYIQVPTSLLAQVDSSVGGKTAVDIDSGKNLVGAFYHPSIVLIDTNVLKTLPVREFRSGMAEVIKYGMISDRDLFESLEKIGNDHMDQAIFDKMDEIVYRSCSIKKSIVEEDEFDRGGRMVLNFGHTIGHGLESYYDYKTYNHGEAVAIGMYEVTSLAYSQAMVDIGLVKRLEEILIKYGLKAKSPVAIGKLVDFIGKDKKVLDGYLNLILVEEIGSVSIKKALVSCKEIEFI